MPAADVLVVGGGIAGVSAAAFLAAGGASVVLLERERALAVHTTGRSAALWLANYGREQTRRLTLASRPFLDHPPAGFADHPLLGPRGQLWVGAPGDEARLAAVAAAGALLDPTIRLVDAAEALALCPVLRPERVVGGVLEPGAADLDVAALHAGFVRMLRAAGGTVVTAAEVTSVRGDGDRAPWEVTAGGVAYTGRTLLDAAGAWGDVVAVRAGVRTLGLRPLRRTALTVALPEGVDASGWPAVIDVGDQWYMKPEPGGLLLSPADETLSDPVDVRPDDLDVALALERVAEATTLPLRSVRSSWAGLRTFAPDGELVLGPDPGRPAFVWCVGQGGYGIQTAPAAGRLTAALVLGAGAGSVDGAWATAAGLDAEALGPARLRGRPPA